MYAFVFSGYIIFHNNLFNQFPVDGVFNGRLDLAIVSYQKPGNHRKLSLKKK